MWKPWKAVVVQDVDDDIELLGLRAKNEELDNKCRAIAENYSRERDRAEDAILRQIETADYLYGITDKLASLRLQFVRTVDRYEEILANKERESKAKK